MASLAKMLIGVEDVVVEGVGFDDGRQAVVIDARPRGPQGCRCGRCGRRAPRYDGGRGSRLWRCCDLAGARVYVRCDAFRVDCPDCGPTVRAVPWAAHGSRFTRAFEDTCCWCALSMSKLACQRLMRVSWRTVGAICSRVEARLSEGRPPRTEGLARIGVDETSYRRGHSYMTVGVNHDTGAVVWCADGHGRAVLDAFFASLTQGQRDAIELVSADGARWVDASMAEWVPRAARCVDTFHVVQWATELLDEVRRQAWREAHAAAKAASGRRTGRGPGRGHRASAAERSTEAGRAASAARGVRWALLKNPEGLTARQAAELELAAASNPRLYRAYLLKEGLRLALKAPAGEIREAVEAWRGRAWRSRIPEFVELQRKVRRHMDAIVATATHGLTNARVEAVNNKIKLIVKMAYGFRNVDNLFSMVMLKCSDLRVELPGRAA